MEAHCIKKDNHDYPFFEIMELYQAPGSPDMILERAVDEIPGLFLAHGKVSSRIIWKDRFFDSPDFDTKGRKLTSEIVVNGNRNGVIEIYFNKVQTDIGKWDMPSFPSRNSNLLLDRISKLIGSLLEKDSLIDLLNDSEANLRNILDRLQEHIFVLDSRGNILDCNRSSMDCLNFGCNQIAGFRLADTGFLDPQTIDEIIENTLLSGRFSLEIECHCPDETTTVWIDSCCMDYNKEQAVLCIIRDISKSREYEDELKKQAEDLKSSGELKELFIDIIRHDLLTPAGIIKGFTEELLLGPSEEEKYMAIRKIYENTNRLIELLDSATKLSKLQKVEEIPFQSMDLVPFFLMVAESLQIQAQERRQQVNINKEIRCPAKVNPIIEEVFANLLSNAIKYSPEKSTIDIDFLDMGNCWKVLVKDSGFGISDADKEFIFDRFRRADRGGIKGSGLGLAIVKRIIELHGGTYGVEDNPEGQGSIFWVTVEKS